MKLTFIGATHEVTGSCTMLEVNSKRYLIDCGMQQGIDVFENIEIPVPATDIEAVFLTHAHVDHSGMLPKLYKNGFRGPIYSTEATRNLCEIMLLDCAHIQETEAEWKSKKAKRSGGQGAEPEYTIEDAQGAIRLFRGCSYAETVKAGEGIEIRFTDVGHLLGSACIEMWLSEGGTDKKIVFSGDIGNTNQALINDPKTVDETDFLVIESTYGNRLHKNQDVMESIKEFAGYIQKTLDRKGTVVIPSFAVGRTQELLYAIREIKQKGLVTGHDGFKVYVDSPLAQNATAIFMQCESDYFDEETKELIDQGINPIWFDDIVIAESADESKLINANTEPKVIISSSGMCEAGRIKHHLKHNLWKEENLILFCGYQSLGTLGRSILDGAERVTIFSEKIAVNAEVAALHGTSGHADKDGLAEWFAAFKKKPQMVFVNHGEDEACLEFAGYLESNYDSKVIAPFSGTVYDLAADEAEYMAEGIRIERDDRASMPADSRSKKVYDDLNTAATDLEALAKASKGMANKDLIKLTNRIRSLIDDYK